MIDELIVDSPAAATAPGIGDCASAPLTVSRPEFTNGRSTVREPIDHDTQRVVIRSMVRHRITVA